MEANLIELGVLKLGKTLPYLEGEHYQEMILRLVKETLEK